jgi:hypothetical protein
MPPNHSDLLHRISLGGDDGRHAFLNLWLTAVKNRQTSERKRLLQMVIEWDDKDTPAWPEKDRNLLAFFIDEITAAMKIKDSPNNPSQETMMRIVTGGENGRRAFLALCLKATFDGDGDRVDQLLNVILQRIWDEQDKAGSEYWPESDRRILRFTIKEIGHALAIDEE